MAEPDAPLAVADDTGDRVAGQTIGCGEALPTGAVEAEGTVSTSITHPDPALGILSNGSSRYRDILDEVEREGGPTATT